jgi:hypothetical protein
VRAADTMLLAAALAFVAPARAQNASDPNLAFPNAVVTAQRDGYTIAGLATHVEGRTQFRYGVAIFPGSPGVIRLREENGQIRHGQVGNFLVRSRRWWLDDETLTLLVDAPSDQWNNFSRAFRATPRYGEDIKALIEETARRYQVTDWTFIGTSEGSLSAFHAARMNPQLAKRVAFTSSVIISGKIGPAMGALDLDALKVPALWVHHVDDACPFAPYGEAARLAEKMRAPLMSVRGGGPFEGDVCGPYFPHGYVGHERAVVEAIRGWVKGGAAPRDIGAPPVR